MAKRKSAEKCSLAGWIEGFMKDLNNEDLIIAIEQHPALWDSRISDYSDCVVKDMSWFDVCAKLDGEFEQRNKLEKHLLRKLVSKRWRNVRDCYTRDYRRMKSQESGGLADRKKPYTYASMLHFLEPVICQSKNQSNAGEDEGSTVKPEQFQLIMRPTPARRKPPQKEDDFTQCLVEEVTKQSIPTETLLSSDGDTLFFMSLVDDFKKVPDDMKMLVKTQIMNVILQNQVYAYDGS